MDKQALLGQRGYFNMVHGVTLRLMATFGDDGLDFRPQPGMRSARELFVHIYMMEKTLAENIRSGRLSQETVDPDIPETAAGKAIVASLQTVGELQAFARKAHQALDDTLAAMSDEDVQQNVEASYGSFPAAQFFMFAYDEHWHHRGQLYTYARLAGKEPPMLYDYENSPIN